MKRTVAILALAVALLAGGCSSGEDFTKEEIALINGSGKVMHVLVVSDSTELAVLRTPCAPLTDKDLRSPEYHTLASKLISTVTDPTQDGVGIAGPQVGLSRRVIAVCRIDKPGEPFEVYANPHLDTLWGATRVLQEGCLSIPGLRGRVPRSQFAVVSYKDPHTLEVKRDTVSEYVARIFQHECDHLDGVFYTDRTQDIWQTEP